MFRLVANPFNRSRFVVVRRVAKWAARVSRISYRNQFPASRLLLPVSGLFTLEVLSWPHLTSVRRRRSPDNSWVQHRRRWAPIARRETSVAPAKWSDVSLTRSLDPLANRFRLYLRALWSQHPACWGIVQCVRDLARAGHPQWRNGTNNHGIISTCIYHQSRTKCSPDWSC